MAVYFFLRNNGKLYTTKSHYLYRNHPLIIALDNEHYFLLEHPLVQQLILHKWKLYRSLFYLSRLLIFFLLISLSFYVLIVSPPSMKSSINILEITLILFLQWIIFILASINFLKIVLEIILYRGLRVPFVQCISMISFLTSIIAFIPYEKINETIVWQWQLAAFSTLFQWFNMALILRSVPFIGNFIVMFQSILMNFFSLIFIILPLLIAFTIATQMTFFNHPAFATSMISMHRLSVMLLGEFDYEILFYSKPTFLIAVLIFIPFITIMTIIFMNLLLGLTIGDIKICMKNAQAKASEKYF